jgi:hypothetical protein
VAAALDHTHMQEGIARPIGKLYEAKSLVRIVPFDYGLDRRTEGRFKPLRTRSECRSETAPGCFEVVVVEATATGRAKISVSAAHVILSGPVGMLRNLKCGGVVVNEFRMMRGRKTRLLCERDRGFESGFSSDESVTNRPGGFQFGPPT